MEKLENQQKRNFQIMNDLERKIVLKEINGERRVYNNNLYYMELTVARKLLDLNAKSENNVKVMEAKVKEVEEKVGIKLEDLQG